MIRIMIDGASDFTFNEIKEKELLFVPLHIGFNDEAYIESETMKRDMFYEKLINSLVLPKTSQPSPQEFVDVFTQVKEAGDEAIYLAVASGLSGTYQSACIAKDIVEYEGIHIVDTNQVTVGIQLLAEIALSLVKEGKTVNEIIEQVTYLCSKIKLMAGLDTLEFLAKGGRISSAVATIGNMAKLKPIIEINKEGKIDLIGKCLGKSKAVNYLLKETVGKVDENYPVYTIYTYGTELVDSYENKLKENNIVPDKRCQAGAVIGTHIGPGAFGVVFIGK